MQRIIFILALIVCVGCGRAPDRHQTLGDVNTANITTSQTTVTSDRKVIFTAAMKLIVTNLAEVEEKLPALVKEHEGYLAEVAVDRTHGENISGRWTARIPVVRYDSFLKATTRLGAPEIFSQQSQDVTEEFVDLNSRITNEKRLEERIVELLKNPAGNIDQVIAVERELARVRGEIEKMEGRVRYLTDRTEFTTVSIEALERKTYVPPREPTFLTRLAESWSQSVATLRRCAEDLVVAAAAFMPWLISGAAIVCIGLVVLRLLWNRRIYPAVECSDVRA